jgi:NAD(P)-dependent dehydrogenase (short-subunit alcohol dehydrogenase family)
MLMSVIEATQSVLSYPELAGKRVLVTGLTSSMGVDVARAFAEHKTRLILQFAEASETMQTVAEIAAPSALDIKAFGAIGSAPDDVVAFARTAAQAFGGLDAVVNLVALTPAIVDAASGVEDIERLVAARLTLPYLLSKIAANRMSVMMTEGLVLNVAALTGPTSRARTAFASVTKAALTSITRAQAEEWAPRGIRFNAVAPQTLAGAAGESLSGETDVAQLALYLASGRGKKLSGCVFEADCAHSPA